jgi:hypothetical protein
MSTLSFVASPQRRYFSFRWVALGQCEDGVEDWRLFECWSYVRTGLFEDFKLKTGLSCHITILFSIIS